MSVACDGTTSEQATHDCQDSYRIGAADGAKDVISDSEGGRTMTAYFCFSVQISDGYAVLNIGTY